MIATSAASSPPASHARFLPLLTRLPALVPNQWLVLGFSNAAEERVLASYGPIEIRQTRGGLAAQTRVKGEQEQALATALQRVRQFLYKNQRNDLDVRLQRPLVQAEEAPGRWVVRMGLIGPPEGIVSPASRGGRVRVIFAGAENVATLRVAGRATTGSVRRAAARIFNSLEITPWEATGEPLIRFQSPFCTVPLLAHFEVAIPVSRRG